MFVHNGRHFDSETAPCHALRSRIWHCQLNEMALTQLPLDCRLPVLSRRSLPLPVIKPLVRELSLSTLPGELCAVSDKLTTPYPELVTRNAKGEIEGIWYEELTPLLLDELQHQRQEIATLKASLMEQNAALAGFVNSQANDAGSKYPSFDWLLMPLPALL